MPFNGAGIFSRTPGTRIAYQGALTSAQVNDETDNLVTGINGKLNLDGLLAMTGNLTLAGTGTALLHSANIGDVQSGIVQVASAVAGTVDAIQITMSPAKTTWTTKERIVWTSGGANTITAPTISKDGGSTSKTIKKGASVALAVGDLGASGTINTGYYNGTDVIWLGAGAFIGGTLTATTSMSGKAFNEAKGAAVASAGTADIWTPADGNYIHITGTVTITSLGTAPQAGAERTVIFDGALTLTHNATSLILPGAANITTAAGDRMIVRADTTANMNVISYVKASGVAVVVAAPSAWTLIETLNPSAVAQQDSSSLAGYNALRITIYGLTPASDADLNMQKSPDGSTFTNWTDTMSYSIDMAAAAAVEGVASDPTILLSQNASTSVESTASGGGWNGTIMIYNFNQAEEAYGEFRGLLRNGGGTRDMVRGGFYDSGTTARTHLRFAFSGANISSGRIVIEGIQ